MLHMFAMVFKCFSGVFASVSLPFLYVATVASGCFKSKSSFYTWDARWKRPATRTTSRMARTTTGAFPREPDVLGARLLLCRQHPNAYPDISKYVAFLLAARVLASLVLVGHNFLARTMLPSPFPCRSGEPEVEPVGNPPHVEID